MTTYLTMIVQGNELLKYMNNVNSSVPENGSRRQMTAANTFYYHHNSLIKVEEYIVEGERNKEVSWYYSDNKPIYWTLQSEEAEERANFLLTMSKTLLSKIIK